VQSTALGEAENDALLRNVLGIIGGPVATSQLSASVEAIHEDYY